MKIPLAIVLLILGVILLIGGLFAFDPGALEPSRTLTRLSPALAPWLFISGSVAGLLGLTGLIGVFRTHERRHAH
jgi:hypothetical protein